MKTITDKQYRDFKEALKDVDRYARLKSFISSSKQMLLEDTDNAVVAMIRLNKLEMINTIEDFIDIIK